MARKAHFYIRRAHRYLGITLGIQFLFWTIGGLYFSWSDMDEIHGDFQRKHVHLLAGDFRFVSPDSVISKLPHRVDSINSIQIVNILHKPFYSITYFSDGHLHQKLADAQTAELRPAITQDEAIKIATESFNAEPKVKSVELLTTTSKHHEYREKPMPAWAVTFDHPSKTTVYVSAEIGKVESFRNHKWRIFDFLWMMHTMDYESRDDLNNLFLRIFSIFGLVTIISGFTLFFVSSKYFRKRKVVFDKG